MIEWLPWLPSKSCYTNLKFFETLKDTPNPSKGFRFVAFLVLEILGGPFRPPLVLGVGTKTLGARRVKNKSGETLVNGFQSILDLGRSPEKLQTDKGTEFLNRNFQSFLKEKYIHFFTTNSELKASVVERFNRTLKTRMWKYFTAKNTRVYIDILQDIANAYNNSYHRSIGQAPASVSLLNVGQVRRKLYGKS